MRDGVELATDVHRPDDGERHPVLLERTPYDRGSVPIAGLDTLSLIEAGYVIVTQDCRGRFGSEGVFTPFVGEAADGVDAIAWCAAQPWSNGRVGMIGGSYVGATQWLPAGQRPPALGAIAPYVTASDYHEGWVYQGGAFQLGFSLRWSLESLALPKLVSREAAGEPVTADIAELRRALRDIRALYRTRPLRGIPLMRHAPWYDEWLAHPARDAFWQRLAPQEHYGTTAVPALNIAGWYDIFADGTYRNFQGMRADGATEAARQGQRLIVGPWSHSVDNGIFAERHYGSLAGLGAEDPTTTHRRFFDRWLRDIKGDEESPVRGTAVVQRSRRDDRRFVRRRDAVDARRPAAARARGDRALRHGQRLPRGLGLPGRGVPARVLAALVAGIAGTAEAGVARGRGRAGERGHRGDAHGPPGHPQAVPDAAAARHSAHAARALV
jgi:putative CocE/NonD family hydrolase